MSDGYFGHKDMPIRYIELSEVDAIRNAGRAFIPVHDYHPLYMPALPNEVGCLREFRYVLKDIKAKETA